MCSMRLDAAEVRAASPAVGASMRCCVGRPVEHGDVDLGVPSDGTSTGRPIEVLLAVGLRRSPRTSVQRGSFSSARLGKVDLHPIVMLPSGAGVQTGFDGQTFEYPPGSLEAEGEIGGADQCDAGRQSSR